MSIAIFCYIIHRLGKSIFNDISSVVQKIWPVSRYASKVFKSVFILSC